MKTLLTTTLVVASLALGYAGVARAQDGAGHDPSDEMAMASRMMELMAKHAPGEHHARLARMAGTWDAEVKMWMAGPDGPAQTAHGVARNAMILGGKFLESRYDGDFMGTPFEGFGLTAYDAEKEQYVGLWIDSFLTSILPLSHGTNDGDVITLTATMDDPLKGVTVERRDVVHIESDDRHVYESFETLPGLPEYKSMEIVYTRRAD